MIPQKPKLLFIDDRTKRIHWALWKYSRVYTVVIAPNVKEALRAMSKEFYEVISLDHDLNGDDFQNSNDKSSGMEIVRWLERYGYPFPSENTTLFAIHTSNAFVATTMRDRLSKIGLVTGIYPFTYNREIEWIRNGETQ